MSVCGFIVALQAEILNNVSVTATSIGNIVARLSFFPGLRVAGRISGEIIVRAVGNQITRIVCSRLLAIRMETTVVIGDIIVAALAIAPVAGPCHVTRTMELRSLHVFIFTEKEERKGF